MFCPISSVVLRIPCIDGAKETLQEVTDDSAVPGISADVPNSFPCLLLANFVAFEEHESIS
jgi:hypothetical protein